MNSMIIKRTLFLMVSDYNQIIVYNYLSLILLVLNQEIEIIDLPYGKNFFKFILRVYDQRSGLTGQPSDESTEIIDTTIISGFP